jgi:hypothetical protein
MSDFIMAFGLFFAIEGVFLAAFPPAPSHDEDGARHAGQSAAHRPHRFGAAGRALCTLHQFSLFAGDLIAAIQFFRRTAVSVYNALDRVQRRDLALGGHRADRIANVHC